MTEAIGYLTNQRNRTNMTQAKVGKDLGVSAALVSQWENSWAKPNLRDLFGYAHAVGGACDQVSQRHLSGDPSPEENAAVMSWLVADREGRRLPQRIVGKALGASQSEVSALENSSWVDAERLFAYAHATEFSCAMVHRLRLVRVPRVWE